MLQRDLKINRRSKSFPSKQINIFNELYFIFMRTLLLILVRISPIKVKRRENTFYLFIYFWPLKGKQLC